MTKLMRGKTNQYLKMWLKTRGVGGKILFLSFIANGALWINLDHQLRAENLPIVSNIVYNSAATYFILVIVNVMDCFWIDANTRGSVLKKGGPLPKKGGQDPMQPPPPP